MDIRKFISPQQILVGEEFSDKEALMAAMLDALVDGLPDHMKSETFKEDCWKRILEREELGTTVLGQGLFLPHARMPSFRSFGLSIAVLRNPIPCNAPDGEPIKIACMMVTSEENPGLVLKVYRTLISMLKDQKTLDAIDQAPNAEALHELIQSRDLDLSITLTAADIMKKPFFDVLPTDSLPRITNKMAHHREPATAVIDEEGMMLGEITCDNVFKYGMPNFFEQLKSVSFVRNFNPLEKYFEGETKNCAADLMTQNYSFVPPDGTLIEIIFELTVKKHTKVYVVDNGKLVGVIGRMNVLDRAVNF